MIVIPPTTMTDGMLTSSTAPEPGAGETAWVSGTTYAVGDEVILVSTHKVYTRLVAGAGTTAPNLDPTNWAVTRPTNRWAMFALDRNTQTELASPLTVVIAPGKRINAIGLVGLECNSVTVELAVGATVYYTRTVTTLIRNTLTWSDYLFGAFIYQPSVVMFDLPPVTGATLTITITGGTCKCAGVYFNMQVYVGMARLSAVSDADNYSRFERDDFGNATLVPRRTVPKYDIDLLIENVQIEKVRALRKELNAVPALWSTLDDKTSDTRFEALLCVGVYKSFPLSFDHPMHSNIKLQLEEM